MKIRTTYRWGWLAFMVLFTLCSSPLFAQDGAADQKSQDNTLLFKGTLNSRNAEEGNTATFHVVLNAGDRITATALCEAAADGYRLIDPALTVHAPDDSGSYGLTQWYNDDSDAVADCIDYSSSRLGFEAPVTGEYRFVVENLAARNGPFSLEVLGSTAIQTQLDIAPAEDGTAVVALAADEQDLTAAAQGVILSFTGVLTGSHAAPNNARTYAIQLNSDDAVSARLVCDEYSESRPLHPQLQVSFTDSGNRNNRWDATAEAAGTRVDCDDGQSSVAVSFTAPEEGSYSFTVSNQNTAHGAYTLSIGGITADQAPQTPALWDGSDPDVEGRWASAEFSGGEGSLIVSLQAGTRIAALAVCLKDEDGNRPANPQVRVLDPNGDEVTTADESQDYQICDGGYSAYIEFTAAITGNYTFEVSASGGGGTTAQAAVTDDSVPAGIDVLLQVPDENDGNGNGNGDGDGDGDGDGGGNGGGGRDCSGGDVLARIGAIACVFSTNTESGRRIDIYYIDSNSRGHFVLSFLAADLGGPPSSETEIASGSGGSYTFNVYHKTNGDLRITGGPNQDGETHEITLSLTPPSTNNNDPAPASTPTPTTTYQAVHTVQAGETLYSIASQYGVTVQAVADANGIAGPDYIIHVGNQLNIPNP